jgi:hydroxymethylglutaryl-CoA lyase
MSTSDKVALIDLLSGAGFAQINATSFVSPRAVPQMADAADVASRIRRNPAVVYDASVPNMKGAQRALESRMDALVVFVSASDAGSRSNVGRSTDDALAEAEQVIAMARAAGKRAVGTVSKAFGSAYEGVTPVDEVLRIAQRLVEAGATDLALGDTSGEAGPKQVATLVGLLLGRFPDTRLALHFHDTRGLALANILAAMDAGATHFDSAVGGIGGSPFTRNSSGNVSTEDLIHMCEDLGVETGVDLDLVLEGYEFLEKKLGHPLPGRLGRVGRSKRGTVQ